MDLDLTEDQLTLVNSVERLVSRYADDTGDGEAYFVPGQPLEADLDAGGYYDVLRFSDQGALDAVLIIEAVVRSPRAAEVAGSVLVAPKLAPDMTLPRPVALGTVGGPMRFLRPEGSALVEHEGQVYVAEAAKFTIEAIETPFAYPFGRLCDFDPARARRLEGVSPEALTHWRRVALAAEIGAVAQAALDLTVDYVKNRRQFNRPIGSFQAIQHRLSECATMIAGARMLARLAAFSEDPADAMFAAAYAKETAAKVHYEAHQFHGAMGVTLEHPLHFWSYRLKYLQGEMGGHMQHALAAARTPGPRSFGAESFLA